MTDATPFAVTRLGQVAGYMHAEAERVGHEGMQALADLCLRRGLDPDEEVQTLVRAVLLHYAGTRGIDISTLPVIRMH